MLLVLKSLIVSVSLVFAAAPSVKSLDAKDPLAKVVKDANQEWLDGNITTGTTTIGAGKAADEVSNARKMKAFSEELFRGVFKANMHEDLPASAKLQVEAEAFDVGAIEDVIKHFMIGNAFDPKNEEARTGSRRQVWKITRALDSEINDGKNIIVSSVSTHVKDAGTDSTAKVFLNVFLNKSTNKLVWFFAFEGTM